MRYLVTTHADRLPTDHQIIMVDGTVPDWQAKPSDRHWDHHRPNGANIQIDEIPPALYVTPDASPPCCFVTTMLDADACCAAAWVQIPPEVLTAETIDRFRAIAWDCDHLRVPEELSQWAEFAAKADAAMKKAGEAIAHELGLAGDRKTWTAEQWETYSSEGFRRNTEWLVAAAKGERPYPGEQGEADDYWQQIEADAGWLQQENRIWLLETSQGAIAICDVQGIGRSVDPRSFYAALGSQVSLESLRPETLMIRDHRLGGPQYTLGSLPLHPGQAMLDFTAGTFKRLTQAEHQHDKTSGGWGGRRTVGGSPWNTPSRLTPEEVVQQIDPLE